LFSAAEPSFTSVALGDSYNFGSDANLGTNNSLGDGMDSHMADWMGWTGHMNSGSGGTGWATTGSAYTFGQRIANGDHLLNGTPSVLCLQGSINDKNAAAATITANVTSAIQTIRAQLPYMPILVFGVWPAQAGTTGTLTLAANETAVQAGVTAVGTDPFLTFIPINGAYGGAPLSGVGYNGTAQGGTSSLTGSGNADVYMYDVTHPNLLGTAAFGKWKAIQAYRALLAMAG
jgi:hypothetical protein